MTRAAIQTLAFNSSVFISYLSSDPCLMLSSCWFHSASNNRSLSFVNIFHVLSPSRISYPSRSPWFVHLHNSYCALHTIQLQLLPSLKMINIPFSISRVPLRLYYVLSVIILSCNYIQRKSEVLILYTYLKIYS